MHVIVVLIIGIVGIIRIGTIIITIMLLLAAVIACVLYRRRRTGKLGLEERRGFVSKGIPIIFAEELEERPSGRHPAKAPVILKVMPHEVKIQ